MTGNFLQIEELRDPCGTLGLPGTVAPFRAWRGSRDLVAQSPKFHGVAVAAAFDCENQSSTRAESAPLAALRAATSPGPREIPRFARNDVGPGRDDHNIANAVKLHVVGHFESKFIARVANGDDKGRLVHDRSVVIGKDKIGMQDAAFCPWLRRHD
jgi:hypothetical protein